MKDKLFDELKESLGERKFSVDPVTDLMVGLVTCDKPAATYTLVLSLKEVLNDKPVLRSQ